MAIVRNKKNAPAADQDAIAAFGAAAEARPEPEATEPATEPAPAPAKKAAKPTPAAEPSGGDGPKSTLVRWEGYEDVRDEIYDYHRRERYTVQTVIIEALRLGLAQMNDR
ncbi:hypothetical protein [Microbacterium thalli]|uniref:hypothetical protein n=1 Tax=Microbacterium thalli TaxID=3027921 RepID=UPI00236641F1|nr:hypothetical protein [Microbacterium thalli]MDD7930772.1 hypothetical protein [Microbacterium thalli]